MLTSLTTGSVGLVTGGGVLSVEPEDFLEQNEKLTATITAIARQQVLNAFDFMSKWMFYIVVSSESMAA
jgi:hypothetical protein